MSYNSLSTMHIDVLREIGNIGAGNAATAMSQLLNNKIEMIVPSVNIVSFDEMMELTGSPDEKIAAILFRVYGDAPSTVILVFNIEEAETLIRTMLHEPDFSFEAIEEENNQLASSVLEEVGNILAGSYISALSDFTNLHMQTSIPHLGIDMAGAILTYGLLELSQVSDYAIVIDSKVNSNENKKSMQGNFFLLPNPESLNVIFKALGISHHE